MDGGRYKSNREWRERGADYMGHCADCGKKTRSHYDSDKDEYWCHACWLKREEAKKVV